MKIYALLVGIDKYKTKPLNGCVNDIIAVEKFLHDTYIKENLAIHKLLDVDATRQGLIDSFSFFKEAQDGDTCLFYYSGHGSYMPAAKEFWTETDHLLETLVCYDSRIGNGRDLTNKELGFLIWQYSQGKKLNFVVITDSCHSGSVTRAMEDANIWRTDRTAPTRNDSIPVEEFYGFNLVINGEKGYIDELKDGKRYVSIRSGNHIHLAASRDNQTAKEDEIMGVYHGIFTYSLLQTLYLFNAKINYQQLIFSTNTKVKTLALDQDPLLGVVGNVDKETIFLSNDILKNGERIYKVYYDKEKGWTINGGAVNGFRMGDKIKIKDQPEIRISTVGMDTSLFSPTIDVDLDDKIQYDAKIIKNKRIAVSFGWINTNTKWDWQEDKRIIKEKSQNAADFYIVDDDSGLFFIQEEDAKLFLTTKNSKQALFKKIDWNQTTAIDSLIENIDKVCRWYLLKDLENPNSALNPKNFEIKVEEIGVGEASKVEDGYSFYYKFDSALNKWKTPKIKITLTNNSNFENLIAKPVFLGFNYTVDTSTFNQLNLKKAPQNVLFLSKDGQTKDTIALSVEKEYSDNGYNSITEYLKVFVSTKTIETDNFSQEGIELEKQADETRSKSKEINRGAGDDPDEDSFLEDWQTFTLKIVLTKPNEIELKANEEINNLGFIIDNKSQFSGKIGFSTTTELKQRGLRGIKQNAILNEIKGNDSLKPAELMPNHGQGQSFNVIEIFDAQNPHFVNDDTPLVIVPKQNIEANETIVPFGYDEETDTYFPLGTTNDEGQIIINQLPAETISDSLLTQRSFGGSIKIYFYKILNKIGFDYQYPQLAVANFENESEIFSYETATDEIKTRISGAKKVILFIHGIIGDTKEMTKVVKRAKTKNGKFLSEEFDVILTFDYENLGTKLQETAQKLKEKLAEIGLGENQDKELVIVAHSMGGLISRYFIEKLDGHKVVKHLIMLGTPNGGSEWADVRDLAETLLTSAVNGAAFLKPWLIPLSFVGKLLKGAQICLRQMNDTSDISIIPELNDGTIPKTAYSIIAGNTKLLGDSAKIEGALKKIIARLKEKPAYAALDLVIFQNEANDIAVKVKNIKKVNQPITDVFEVASDHISYFGTPASIKKLGELI